MENYQTVDFKEKVSTININTVEQIDYIPSQEAWYLVWSDIHIKRHWWTYKHIPIKQKEYKWYYRFSGYDEDIYETEEDMLKYNENIFIKDKIAYKYPKIILKFTSKRIKEMYFETEKEAKDMYEMLIAMFNNKCLTFNPEYD